MRRNTKEPCDLSQQGRGLRRRTLCGCAVGHFGHFGHFGQYGHGSPLWGMRPIKAFYTVAELATMIGVHPDTVRRTIRRLGMRTFGGGRKGSTVRIPVSEIVEKLDVVLSSYSFAESLRKGDE